MIWYIIGRDMHVLCTASTDLLKSLPIDDSSSGGQTIAITNDCAIGTYDFSVDPRHPDAAYITEGNYIAFRDKYGKDRLYTIMAVEGDESWDVHCEDIGIDLINETAVPWDYTGNPKTIADTLAPVLLDSGWEIGVNEVAGYQRATKYEGTTDSQLTRIGDVCNAFDAECEFAIEMKGAKVTKQVINIYKTLGQDMTQQRFVDGINLISLSKSGSIEDLITCVRCYGKEVDGVRTDISTIEYDDGDFYSPKGDVRIYSREARKKWSRFRAWNYEGQGEFDGYINGTFEYDTDSPQELFNRGLTELKSRCEKKVSYEANLYDLRADIGDTIQIADNRFAEKVYLSARIQSVTNHYSVKGQDTGVLANYKILTANPADDISKIMDQIRDQIVSVKGAVVSYQIGDSGTEPPTGEWSLDIPELPAGKFLWTRTETTYSDGSTTTAYSVSQRGENGKDGEDGTSVRILGSYNTEEELNQEHPTGNLGDAYIVSGDLYVWNGTKWENVGSIQGPQGTPGKPGADGRTSYIHVKYSNDGGFTFTGNNGEDPGSWFGQYTDFIEMDSNRPEDYTWSKIQGERGPQGLQGLQGEKGDQGLPGNPGSDGKSSYTHIAYSNSTDGHTDFSVSDSNRSYIGMYVDENIIDSQNPDDYRWSKIKGADGANGKDGIPGKNGADGKTPYLHIAYANSADGRTDFSTTDSNRDYIGQYTDYIQADSNDPSDYAWSKIKGADGQPGNDGQDGLPGADGVSYTIEPSVSEIRRSADGYSPDTLKFAVYRSVGGAAREEFPCYADFQKLSGGEWTSFYQYASGEAIYEFTILLNTMMTGQADFVKMIAYSDAGFVNQIGECILPVAYNSMETPGTYSSTTPPKNPFIGMLWRNTGTSGGYVQNAIYQWDGSEWQMYYFSARNIEAETLSAITAVLGEVISGKITNKVDGKKAIEILENQIDFYDYTNKTETFAGSLRGSHIGGLSSRTALQLVLAYAFHIIDSHGREIMNIYSDGVDINKTLYYNGRNMGRVFGNLPDDTKLQISNLNDAISYSGEEEMTNKRWFGSYIYKKTINVGAISGADKTINHGIRNVNVIWVDPAGSFLRASNGMIAPFPRVAKLINEQVSWILTKTQLIVQAGTNANFTACYVTLLYTKTTNPQEAETNETNAEI